MPRFQDLLLQSLLLGLLLLIVWDVVSYWLPHVDGAFMGSQIAIAMNLPASAMPAGLADQMAGLRVLA